MKLSLARASAVRLALLARGVDARPPAGAGIRHDRAGVRAAERELPRARTHGRVREARRCARPPRRESDKPRGRGRGRRGQGAARRGSTGRRHPARARRVQEGERGHRARGARQPRHRGRLHEGDARRARDPRLRRRRPSASPTRWPSARAEAVRAYMVACGVSDKHMAVRAERSGRAVARRASEDCRTRNGRAELRFVDGQPAARNAGEPAPPRRRSPTARALPARRASLLDRRQRVDLAGAVEVVVEGRPHAGGRLARPAADRRGWVDRAADWRPGSSSPAAVRASSCRSG